MVRLVISDFISQEENEAFYATNDYDTLKKFFTYKYFKKHTVYLPTTVIGDDIYSLNLLSGKHLPSNQFLVYIDEERFYILFNHKTVYRAKINKNYITDDIIKSILITKHIVMLSSGGNIKEFYYLINAEYDNAIKNLLIQNIQNITDEKEIAVSLGGVKELTKKLNPLDDIKSHSMNLFTSLVLIVSSLWIAIFGLNILFNLTFEKQSLSSLKRDIKLEKILYKRDNGLLKVTNAQYKNIISCIPKKEVKND